MAKHIQMRRDTAANWEHHNPVLMQGEMGIVTDDPNLYKVGDGTTAWNSLPYRGYNGTIAQGPGESENAVMSQKATTHLVSVSQNTSTGHTDINIGSDSYPVASVEDVSRLDQQIDASQKDVIKSAVVYPLNIQWVNDKFIQYLNGELVVEALDGYRYGIIDVSDIVGQIIRVYSLVGGTSNVCINAFADDSFNIIGEPFATYTGDDETQIKVPQGATKLYISNQYAIIGQIPPYVKASNPFVYYKEDSTIIWTENKAVVPDDNSYSIIEAAGYRCGMVDVSNLNGQNIDISCICSSGSSGSLGRHVFVDSNETQVGELIIQTPSNNPNSVKVPQGAAKLYITDLEVISPELIYVRYAQKDYVKDVILALKDQIDNMAIDGSQWKGKKWYAYGTSITDTSLTGKYPKYIDAFSGLIRTNRAISGSGITSYSNQGNYNAVRNITDGKLDADLITLEVGQNDGRAPLGDVTDMSNNDTLCGALNLCIKYLQANTSAQIVIICSPQDRYSASNPSQKFDGSQPMGSDNHYWWETMEAIRKVCILNSCWFIDGGAMSGLGLARMNSNNLYNIDNVHHTELGGYNFALAIWATLKNIPLFKTQIDIII